MSNVVLQVLERDLPDLPAQMSEVIAELKDPNLIDLPVLITKISQCGNLSEIVLRMVNSGYLRHGRKADDLEEAVILVGMEAVRHTILGVVLYSMFSKRQVLENFNRMNFLRHCLGTALAARMLSTEAGLDEQLDSYKLITYGLLHDIGIVALDRAMPITLNRIFKMAAEENMPILEAEVRVLGKLTHSMIGEWVCGKWNLPQDIRNVVQYHHAPRKAKLNRPEVALMHIADVISFNYYESLTESVHKYALDMELLRSLGLNMGQIAQVEEALPERVERAMRALDFDALESLSLC